MPMGSEMPSGSLILKATPNGPARPRFRGTGSLPRKGRPPRPRGRKAGAIGGRRGRRGGTGGIGVEEEIGVGTKVTKGVTELAIGEGK